jgi:hypothetical protein
MKKFLTTEEAAAYTGYAPSTLEKLRCVGGGPRFIKRPGGRRILYDIADLEAWLLPGRRGSTSEKVAEEGKPASSAA